MKPLQRSACVRHTRPGLEPLEARRLLSSAAAAAATTAQSAALAAATTARQMENLNRGLVAVRSNATQAFISWRLLGTDSPTVGFNLYRSANGAAPVKLNASPLTGGTNYTDSTTAATNPVNFAQNNAYFVRPVLNGVEQQASETYTLAPSSAAAPFLTVPLQVPEPRTATPNIVYPDGFNYTYHANDMSVGDLDGDGDYEYIVKWEPSNAQDNTGEGFTGNVLLEAYQTNGTRLWQQRIDLGINIRAGAHYTQYMVYDFDGDGKAEIAVKTAPGTKDGLGNDVILPGHNPNADYRNYPTTADDSDWGRVLTGPEYLTIFNGQTGAAMATTPFLVARGNVSDWGDGYGNRVDRFLAGVAYLDGQRPSLIMARGYYERTTLTAWDWRNGQLTNRWVFDTENQANDPDAPYEGQGTHSLSIADADGDGKDEIIYGAATIDDNGTGLGRSGLGHGDALHVSDMDPARPGLEVYQVHEGTGSNGHWGASVRDAATGQVLVQLPVTQNTDGSWPDVGRGVAMDVHPSPGYEFWSSAHGSIYAIDGTPIHAKGNAFQNFALWWDGDLYREMLDGTTVAKWGIPNGGRSNFDLDPTSSNTWPPNTSSINGTKNTPNLSGDVMGDWREEVIWRRTDSTAFYIYTTTIPTTTRLTTLMHDAQYRVAVAWQNVGYNQPPHPSFFLGNGMTTPPQPNIYLAGAGTAPPSVVSPAAANPNPVTGTTSVLSVLGDDLESGEAGVTYTWSVTGTPPGAVTFSANGTNAAKTTTATFAAQGLYQILVTLTDPTGRTATSAVNVTVTDQIVWYKNDVSSGATLPDAAPPNRPATLSGAYSFVPGARGNAVKLTGGRADLPAGIVSGVTADFTIATWVKMDTVANWARVFDFGTGTATYVMFTPRASQTGLPRFAIRTNGGTEQQLNASQAIPAGQWTHIAVTLTGNAATMYLNGVAVATNAAMTLRLSSLGNTTNNYLGDSQFSADPALLGSIDDFRILSRALSQTEIRDAMGAQVAGKVFHDVNGDGAFNAGEPTFNDVVVYLDGDNDGVLDTGETTAVTTGAGDYTFASIVPGNYTLRGVAPLPDGFVVAQSPAVAATAGNVSAANLVLARNVYAGTAGADAYTLRKAPSGKFEILIGGALAYTVFSGVPSLTFELGEGDDTLTLDLVNGAPIPAGGATFDGGAGAADRVAVIGKTAVSESATFNATGVALSGGSLTLAGAEAATFDGNGGADHLTVNGGPAVLLPDAQQIQSLTINGSAAVALAGGRAAPLGVAALALAPNARLDVADNALVLKGGGNAAGTLVADGVYGGWQGVVQRAYNGGAWDGPGITTSAATAQPDNGGLATLALATAADVLGLAPDETALWNGQTVSGADVLVAYTWVGDANLDGAVDGGDYAYIDVYVGATAADVSYLHGDFNYDGYIDGGDYAYIDVNVGAPGAPL